MDVTEAESGKLLINGIRVDPRGGLQQLRIDAAERGLSIVEVEHEGPCRGRLDLPDSVYALDFITRQDRSFSYLAVVCRLSDDASDFAAMATFTRIAESWARGARRPSLRAVPQMKLDYASLEIGVA
ncbi:MAG: hypothetical protein Q8J89_02965 [Caulobacter sp.]|nr:hypothetical protein [Caulobacter sp.]